MFDNIFKTFECFFEKDIRGVLKKKNNLKVFGYS